MPAGLRLSTNVYGDETILVPRPDGRVTIAGVTIESVGFDSRVTTEGIRSIMERSTELVPALADAVVEQAYAGLRPASADGLPIIGRPERRRRPGCRDSPLQDGYRAEPDYG